MLFRRKTSNQSQAGKPRSEVLTIAYVEIVGFALMAERDSPEIAFQNLHEITRRIQRLAADENGTVNPLLGDRLLVAFSGENHVERGLRYAVRLQKENLRAGLESSEHGKPVCPLRIGINTDMFFVDDLNRPGRVIIGSGVGLAARLETFCEAYFVLCAPSTRERVAGESHWYRAMKKCQIKIKSHEPLLEAYEINPFAEEPLLLVQGVSAYRKALGISRVETRWPVAADSSLAVTSELGRAKILNFSESGLCLRMESYFAVGTLFTLRIDSDDGGLGHLLHATEMPPLDAEIRWARAEGDGYVHGVLFRNLTAIQKKELLSCLRKATQPEPAPDRARWSVA